eukprot:1931115-Alexandrium_andersonii.AAC.1
MPQAGKRKELVHGLPYDLRVETPLPPRPLCHHGLEEVVVGRHTHSPGQGCDRTQRAVEYEMLHVRRAVATRAWDVLRFARQSMPNDTLVRRHADRRPQREHGVPGANG